MAKACVIMFELSGLNEPTGNAECDDGLTACSSKPFSGTTLSYIWPSIPPLPPLPES